MIELGKYEIDADTECWNHCNKPKRNGYIQLTRRHNGKKREYSAHRVSYMNRYGRIPEGMNVLHSCDNPICVNPNHLFLGTLKDNTQDMLSKYRAYQQLSEDDIGYIIVLHERGLSNKEIAKSLGIHYVTVSTYLSRR